MKLLRNRDGATLGAGLTIGLLLSYRPWIVFAVGVVVGVLLVGGWQLGRQLLSAFEAWRQVSRTRRRTPAWVRNADLPSKQTEDIPF